MTSVLVNIYIFFFLQNLLTDDKILSIKSEVNGIHVRNSAWLQNAIKIKSQNGSNIVQRKLRNKKKIGNTLIVIK